MPLLLPRVPAAEPNQLPRKLDGSEQIFDAAGFCAYLFPLETLDRASGRLLNRVSAGLPPSQLKDH